MARRTHKATVKARMKKNRGFTPPPQGESGPVSVRMMTAEERARYSN